MAGILDSKERVMDFIITQEGKRQAGHGELRVKFASFTDCHTFYEKSGSLELPDLADDASDRIFFEAYSRYQDIIVPELEAGTYLAPFRTSDFDSVNKKIASGSFQVGAINRLNILSGPDLPAAAPELLVGITKNFNDQQIIGSVDLYSFSNDFAIRQSPDNFSVDESFPYLRSNSFNQESGLIQLENVPNIFNDRRFANFSNFLFLPPENLPLPGQSKGDQLAEYAKLDEKPLVTFDEIAGFLKDKQYNEISFNSTSRFNNLVCQIFESSRNSVDKLAIVDLGNFEDEEPGSPESIESPGKRVFCAGKIRKDATGAETFVNLFTIVID